VNPGARAVLAINAGSSSVKFGLFTDDGNGMPVPLVKGTLDDAGSEPRLTVEGERGSSAHEQCFPAESTKEAVFGALLDAVADRLGDIPLVAVGHRVVHGGRDFEGPAVVDSDVLSAINRLTPLAPLHQPRSLEPMRVFAALRPGLRQVACFDTAFHHHLAPPVSRYAIPRRYEDQGIRKYGFHGLSYEFVAGRLAEIAPELSAKRTVVAHLGNGASLCAMQGGRSVDTTMGFSALDGLVMGTRCGALDPGVVLHLQTARGLSADEVEDLLYHQSGLLGVSGTSGDMRVLEKSDDARAREAIDLFAFHVARETAALANTLAGLDTLVFTGGIGEHDASIRAEICRRLGWLGVACDPSRNDLGDTRIDGPGSRVAILVIPTNEESVIAKHALGLMGDRASLATHPGIDTDSPATRGDRA
jgi:acetate kinase